MFADFFSFWTQISFSVISKVFLTTSVFHFLKLEYLFEEIYASQLFYQRLETPPQSVSSYTDDANLRMDIGNKLGANRRKGSRWFYDLTE